MNVCANPMHGLTPTSNSLGLPFLCISPNVNLHEAYVVETKELEHENISLLKWKPRP